MNACKKLIKGLKLLRKVYSSVDLFADTNYITVRTDYIDDISDEHIEKLNEYDWYRCNKFGLEVWAFHCKSHL